MNDEHKHLLTTFWISKYALTQGIYSVEAERCCKDVDSPREYIRVYEPSGISSYYVRTKKMADWHESHDEAVIEAEKMRLKKLASLYKRIEKMSALSFVDSEDK